MAVETLGGCGVHATCIHVHVYMYVFMCGEFVLYIPVWLNFTVPVQSTGNRKVNVLLYFPSAFRGRRK